MIGRLFGGETGTQYSIINVVCKGKSVFLYKFEIDLQFDFEFVQDIDIEINLVYIGNLSFQAVR